MQKTLYERLWEICDGENPFATSHSPAVRAQFFEILTKHGIDPKICEEALDSTHSVDWEKMGICIGMDHWNPNSKYGHSRERRKRDSNGNLWCLKCEKFKPEGAFYEKKGMHSGSPHLTYRDYQCKECRRSAQAKRNLAKAMKNRKRMDSKGVVKGLPSGWGSIG